MGEISVDSHHQPNNLDKLDLRQTSKLDCALECSLDWRNNSYGSKLALRASLRYTGEDDQWQINHSSLLDRLIETNTCLIANCLAMYDSLWEGLTRRPYPHIAIFLPSAVQCSRRFSTLSEHFSWNKQENRERAMKKKKIIK